MHIKKEKKEKKERVVHFFIIIYFQELEMRVKNKTKHKC